MKKCVDILIPNPCNQNWDAMTPNNRGKHCGLCNKTVVDFTRFKTTEIQHYFIENSNKKICGHFYKAQLDLCNKEHKIKKVLLDLYCNATYKIKIKSIRVSVLFLLSIVLGLTGCNTPTTGEIIIRNEKNEKIIGDSIVSQPIDTIKNN